MSERPAPLLSVVIPCYNEGGNIALLVTRLQESFAERYDVEAVIVNNGSTDDSAEILAQHQSLPWLQIVHIARNVGYGHGILQGLAQARGQLLAWTHADLQTDPADLMRGLDIFQKESEQRSNKRLVVQGERINRSLTERVITRSMEIMAALLLGQKFHEINAQPKIFTREFYEDFLRAEPPQDFSLDLFLMHQAKSRQLDIVFFPVQFPERIHGESKGGGGNILTRARVSLRTARAMIKMRENT